MPLPSQISSVRILETISSDKDVDGFNPISRGRLQTNEKTFVPCTPAGILELLWRYKFSLNGKHVVVLGRSGIVGLPLSLLLVQKNETTNATVTICHSGTRDLPQITKLADVLIVAIGQANFVTTDMIKEGAVVIDVGINRILDSTRPKGYRLSGDVDFENVKEKVAAITPVPGGVGPMTIIKLMQNTIEAAELTLCASSSTG